MHVNIPYMDPVAWVILKIVVHKLDIALRQLNNNDKAPPRRPSRKKSGILSKKKTNRSVFLFGRSLWEQRLTMLTCHFVDMGRIYDIKRHKFDDILSITL